MFWSYIGNILFDLRNTNDEYKKIVESIEEELEKHPNLRDVIDEDEAKCLTKKETEALIRIKKLFYEQQSLEHDAIFFAGGRNACYYLKKMNFDNEFNGKNIDSMKAFETAYYDYFGNLFDEVFCELEQNNQEYQVKQKKKNDLLKQFPNLEDVIEMKKTMSLSKEEVEALIKYLDIKMDLEIIKEVAIMYRGMKEEYMLLKNMGIL